MIFLRILSAVSCNFSCHKEWSVSLYYSSFRAFLDLFHSNFVKAIDGDWTTGSVPLKKYGNEENMNERTGDKLGQSMQNVDGNLEYCLWVAPCYQEILKIISRRILVMEVLFSSVKVWGKAEFPPRW